MPFVVLPDDPLSAAAGERAGDIVGDQVLRYPSGRPWIISAPDAQWHEIASPPGARIVSTTPPATALDIDRLAGNPIDHHSWNSVAGHISAHAHFIGQGPGGTRFQGNLSGSCRFFWALDNNLPLVSDSPAVLRAMTGAAPDLTSVALSLAKAMPIQPFAHRTMWSGITAVGVGRWLRLPPGGVPSTHRWWSPTGGPALPVAEAASGVRDALRDVLRAQSRSADLVTADLSGGLDSTSICYALNDLGRRFRTFRTSSTSPWNDETGRARAAAADLGVELVEFPPLSETSTAFALDARADPVELAEGPVVWSASRGYLDVLAPAVAATGSRVHFTGLGGDELFDVVPGVYRSVWAERGLGALGVLRRHQLSGKFPLRPFASGVADRRSYAAHLRSVVAAVAAGRAARRADSYSWFPPPVLPGWLTAEGRALVVGALEEAAAGDPEPLGADPTAHQVVESISYQGQILRQFGVVFAGTGITWQAPFTDRRVVEAALRAPVSARLDAREDKRLLAEAVAPFMPRELFAKRDRGDFTADIYAEHRRRRHDLVAGFATARLADLGLVDPHRLLPHLESPALADVGLLELERVVGAERWLRAIDNETRSTR